MLPVGRLLSSFLGNVRFPVLLVFAAGLFALNLFVPDPIPFVDEILMGLATLFLSRLRRPLQSQEEDPAP